MRAQAISRQILLAAIAAVPVISSNTYAADVIKANNADNLDLTTSWVGGVLPTNADVAVWDGTVTAANSVSLGTDQSYLGLRIANPGGDVTVLGGSTLTLGASGIDMSAAAANLELQNALTLGASQTWSVNTGFTLRSTGGIGGVGFGITKTGAGTLALSGASTYTGATTLNAGTLAINGATAIGTGTLIINGGILDNTSGGAITLTSNNVQSWNGDFAFAGSNNLNLGTGAVTLGASRTVDVAANTLTVGGAIGGVGFGLTKTGAGTLTLSGTSIYTGGTTVSAGALSLGNGGGAGSIQGNILNNASVIYNRNNTTTYAGVMSGSGTVTKIGAGTVIFTNANTYTGGTTINAGTVQIGNYDSTGSIPLNNVVLNTGTLALNRSVATTLNTTGITGTGTLALRTNALNLNFAAGGAPATDILANTVSLNLQPGTTLNVTGTTSAGPQQTLAGTAFGNNTAVLGGGMTTINVVGDATSSANPTLSLGVISSPIGNTGAGKSSGVAIRFLNLATQDGAGAPVAPTGLIRASALTNTGTNGVLGAGAASGQAASGYATVGLYDFAGVDAADNNIIKGGSQYAFYTPSATNANYNTGGSVGNLDFTTQGGNVGGGNRFASTVRFNTPAANTVTLAGTLWHVNGVLVTPNMGATNVLVTTGTTASIWDSGRNNVDQQYQTTMWQNNTAGFFTADVPLTNNRGNTGDTQPMSLVKAGAGTMVLARNNSSYSGGTIIYEGALMFSASDLSGGAGTGPLGNPAETAGAGVPTVRLNGGTLVGNGLNINLASTRGIGLTGPGTIASTNGNKLTINGVISNAAVTAGALTIGNGTIAGTGVGTANPTLQTGSGVVALAGASTYTAGTNVGNSATLLAVNTTGSATGTGAVTVNSTGTLGGTGVISGSANIQSGGRLNAGVPGVLSGLGTLTTGGVNFSAGSILDLDMTASVNDMIVSTNGLSVTDSTAFNLFAAGTASPFTINGTYNIFNVTAGSIPSVGDLNTNFDIANPVLGGNYLWGVSGTTVTLNISGLTTVATWVNPIGATWNSNPNWSTNSVPNAPAASAIMGSALTTSGQVTLDGSRTVGALTFNNALASYDIAPGSGGTLNIDGGFGAALVSNVNGNHIISAPVNLVSNATFGVSNLANTLTISGPISGANLTVDSGFGTVVLTGTNTYGTTTVSSNDQLQIGNGGTTGTLGAGAVAVNGTLTFNRSDSYSVANNITGLVGGIVTQSGTGTTTLTGTNSGGWGTRVTAGTLTVGTGSGLGTGPITTNGGTLNLNDSTVTTSLLSGTGGNVDNLTGAGVATLIVADTNDATYAGNLRNTSGTLAVSKTGSGNLTLTGNNTMTGGFDVNNGQVLLASSTALPAGSTITTRILGNGIQLRNSANIGGTIVLNPNGNTTNGLIDVTGGVTGTPNNITLSGKITTPIAVTNNATNLRVNAGNDLFNSLTVVGAGSINLPDLTNTTWNGVANFERGHWTWQDNAVLNARPNVWFGRSGASTLSFTFKDNSTANLLGGVTIAAGGAATTLVTTTIQDNAVVTLGKPASSSLYGVIGNVNGGMFLNAGGANTITNLNGGTLWTNSFGTTNLATLNLNGTLIKAEDNNAAFLSEVANLTVNVLAGGAKFDTGGWDGLGKTIRIDEVLANGGGGGGLTKSGLGTLVLAGANSYDGVTQVNAGTLQFANQGALYGNNTGLWTDTNLVVESGATAAFNVGGGGEFTSADIDLIAALGTPTGGFKNGSNIGFDATNAPTFTYSTAIVNPNAGANVRGLRALGGTVVLDGANTYTGTTYVHAGVLSAGSAGAIGTSGDVTFVQSGVTLDIPPLPTSGTLQHTAANTVDYSARIKNSTGPIGIDTNSQNVTYTTGLAASNTGGLTKSGIGTLTLGGANLYTGTTTVTTGKLRTIVGLKTVQPMVINGTGTLDDGVVEIPTTLAGGPVPLSGLTSGVTAVSSLAITANGSNYFGKLELHNNDLVVDYGANPTPFNDVLNMVKSGLPLLGFAGDGTGITSAEVQAQTLPGTMLGVIDGATTGGLVTSVSGYAIANPATSVVVKYTWRGDANLDGVVNGSDYALADTGFSGGGTGWFYGDMNYDGVINGSDYALIDTGFSSQTGPLPEPATLSLLGLGAMGMLRRRRRAV